jgi:flagellar biosynthesis/type III secretory pathway protein FliH
VPDGVRAVIKGAPREGAMARITTAIGVQDPAGERAAEVLRSAYEAARRLQEAARLEAARAVAQAQEQARAEVEAAWAQRLARLDRLLDDLAQQAPRALGERAAPTVVALALEVARRVVGRALEQDPELLVRWAQDAAARLHGVTEVVVRVNPEDLERLGAPPAERAGLRLVWVPDPSVDGGCVVECPAGVVDARLSTQLETLRERLEEVRGG